MKLVKGDLWASKATVILVTTNATLKYNGEVVMGRGAAFEAKRRYPIFPRRLGDLISISGPEYGVAIWAGLRVGAFQVKHNWWEKAKLDLIRKSARKLAALLKDGEITHVAMNFPGIGNGKLERHKVLPIIECLPDSVEVYEYD